MQNKDFTESFRVNEKPEAVYNVLLDVRAWWSGLFGEEIQVGEDGTFTFIAGGGAHYSKQKPEGMIPGRKASWLVTDSKLNFINDETEWTGTRIGFELAPDGDGTVITFTHSGLRPSIECYGQCSAAWSRYLQERLQPLLNGQ